MVLNHYVELFFPGVFLAESDVRKINSRDDKLTNVPKSCFAYQFFDVEEMEVDGELLSGRRKNESPLHYIGGQVFTAEELKTAKLGLSDNQIQNLIWAAEDNSDCGKVIQCRTGNFQPLMKDQVVEMGESVLE